MRRTLPILCTLLCIAADSQLTHIDANQTLEQLPEGAPREQLAKAAQALGDWSIDFAGVPIDGARLQRWADCPENEPLLRFVREDTGRAIDLDDFVFFLDDVLVAGQADRRGQAFTVTSGRARSAGLLVHPDDVFKDKPRQYGVRSKTLSVDAPQPPDSYPPAIDGDPPSPGWSARFQNPQDRPEM
ncbi:MAG: hypothetical protein GWP91_16505, partial [Rhodobacterales bacterium]|nr:hypothetical protein [Rhodobacterales bacterium]